MFVALRDIETSGFVIGILGERYSGEKPLTCCMTTQNRQKVVHALENINTEMPEDDPGWFLPYPFRALENIKHCSSDLPFWQPSFVDEFRSAEKFRRLGEHANAFRLYLEAAAEGHPEANYWAGDYYYKGIVTEKNLTEAEKYFLLAAKKGVVGSMLRLSDMYFHGDGVSKDCEQARYWMENATKGNLPGGGAHFKTCQ